MRKIRSDKGTKRASSDVEFGTPTYEKGGSSSMGREGLGHYYANLGMNKWEVNKRIKARGMDKMTGNHAPGDEVTASYMRNRNQATPHNRYGVEPIADHRHPTMHNLSPVEGAE